MRMILVLVGRREAGVASVRVVVLWRAVSCVVGLGILLRGVVCALLGGFMGETRMLLGHLTNTADITCACGLARGLISTETPVSHMMPVGYLSGFARCAAHCISLAALRIGPLTGYTSRRTAVQQSRGVFCGSLSQHIIFAVSHERFWPLSVVEQ